jgi:arachidonate 15-lipoxygenase
MTAFLPQHASLIRRTARRLEIELQQTVYKYNYSHIPGVAMLDQLPIADEFSFRWLELVTGQVLEGIRNRCELDRDQEGVEHHSQLHGVLSGLLSRGLDAVHEIRLRVHEALRFEGRRTAPQRSAASMQEFENIFRAYGLPPIAREYRNDAVFAAMRTAGPNPIMLRRLREPDERLPITEQLFRTAVPGDSLAAALAEGRLFLADYAILDGAETGVGSGGRKRLFAPLALFVSSGPARELRPVAIQCRQLPAADNPILTPADGNNWLIAKAIVESADGNLHEGSTHLARTHLAMEAFIMATFRQLATDHPLRILLQPHFEGTLAINDSAWKHLVSEGGAVDRLLAGTIGTSRSVALQGLQALHVMNDRLPLTFQNRGVDDRETLPEYPYRDDSLLYWNAIHEWVSAYLNLYYEAPVELLQDTELQAWGRELAAQDGGRLGGLPNAGAFQNTDELIETVTFVLYTCSVQHAAVNFPQADYMTWCPAMPLALYGSAPVSSHGATEADYLAMLPTLDMAELQLEVCDLLGSVHYTQLGQYAHGHFADPRVAASLQRFQQRLADVGRQIETRNSSRKRPYRTLLPGSIPQSINI